MIINKIDRKFGQLIKELRKKKNWTAKDFLEKLNIEGSKLSSSYITKIEVYGEIPSPEIICKMADVLLFGVEALVELAKKIKITRFEKSLNEKYKKAIKN